MVVLTLNHAQTFQFECFQIHHKKRVHLASRKFVIIAKTGSRLLFLAFIMSSLLLPANTSSIFPCFCWSCAQPRISIQSIAVYWFVLFFRSPTSDQIFSLAHCHDSITLDVSTQTKKRTHVLDFPSFPSNRTWIKPLIAYTEGSSLLKLVRNDNVKFLS